MFKHFRKLCKIHDNNLLSSVLIKCSLFCLSGFSLQTHRKYTLNDMGFKNIFSLKKQVLVDYNRNILLVYKTRLGFSMHFFFKRNGISAVPLVLLNTSMRPKLQNDVISTYNCSNLLTFIDVGIYLFTKLHATVNFYIV